MWTKMLHFCAVLVIFTSFADAAKLKLIPNGSQTTYKDGLTHEVSKFIVVPDTFNEGTENVDKNFIDKPIPESLITPINHYTANIYKITKDSTKYDSGDQKSEKIKYSTENGGNGLRYSESHRYSSSGINSGITNPGINKPFKTMKYHISSNSNPGKITRLSYNGQNIYKNIQESTLNQGELQSYDNEKPTYTLPQTPYTSPATQSQSQSIKHQYENGGAGNTVDLNYDSHLDNSYKLTENNENLNKAVKSNQYIANINHKVNYMNSQSIDKNFKESTMNQEELRTNDNTESIYSLPQSSHISPETTQSQSIAQHHYENEGAGNDIDFNYDSYLDNTDKLTENNEKFNIDSVADNYKYIANTNPKMIHMNGKSIDKTLEKLATIDQKNSNSYDSTKPTYILPQNDEKSQSIFQHQYENGGTSYDGDWNYGSYINSNNALTKNKDNFNIVSAPNNYGYINRENVGPYDEVLKNIKEFGEHKKREIKEILEIILRYPCKPLRLRPCLDINNTEDLRKDIYQVESMINSYNNNLDPCNDWEMTKAFPSVCTRIHMNMENGDSIQMKLEQVMEKYKNQTSDVNLQTESKFWKVGKPSDYEDFTNGKTVSDSYPKYLYYSHFSEPDSVRDNYDTSKKGNTYPGSDYIVDYEAYYPSYSDDDIGDYDEPAPKNYPYLTSSDFLRGDENGSRYNGLDYTWEPESIMRDERRLSRDYVYEDIFRDSANDKNKARQGQIRIEYENSLQYLPGYENNPSVSTITNIDIPLQGTYMIPVDSPHYALIIKEYPLLSIKCSNQPLAYRSRYNTVGCGNVGGKKQIVDSKFLKYILSYKPPYEQNDAAYKNSDVYKYRGKYFNKNPYNANDGSVILNSDRIRNYIISSKLNKAWLSKLVKNYNKYDTNILPQQNYENMQNKDMYDTSNAKYVTIPNVKINYINEYNSDNSDLYSVNYDKYNNGLINNKYIISTDVNSLYDADIIRKTTIERKYKVLRLKQLLTKYIVLSKIDTVENANVMYKNILNYVVYLHGKGVYEWIINQMIRSLEQQIINRMNVITMNRQTNPYAYVLKRPNYCSYCQQ